MIVSEVQKNSRQMPKIKEICANKKYNDRLYGYLQSNAEYDSITKQHFIYKKNLNYSKIGEEVDLTRQTVKSKILSLIELGLLVEEEDKYNLEILGKDVADLVERDLLNFMVHFCSYRAISTYLYLFRRYIANGRNPFIFKYDDIKVMIGLSTTTRNNDDVVKDLLDGLKKIGVIQFEIIYVEKYKMMYRITKVVNTKRETGI